MATAPAPPPRPADDVIQDIQRSGWSRWTPRRAGVPALIDWWPTYVLLIALVVLAVLVTVRLAVDFLGPLGHVIVIAGIACVLTFSLAPLVSRLEHWMPRRAAATLVFFGTLGALLALAAVVAWQLGGEGERLSNQLTQFSEALKGNRSLALGPYEIPPNIQERVRDLSDQGARIDEWSAAMSIGLVTSLIDLVLVLVVTFYLLLDVRRLRATVLRWLEPSHRPGARRVFSEIARVFGAYVRAQLMVAASLGLLVAIVLIALGVPYALFLALFAALAELIPMVGPIAGAVPALLVAATLPLPTVIWVAIAFVLIQQIESNFLLPRLTGHAVGLHPVGSILALVLGFELGGVIGALFAVPLAGLAWVFVFTAVRAWRDKRIDLQRTVDPATLRRRRAALRQRALAAAPDG
jgi:predicted PurR-regulated permease PerM